MDGLTLDTGALIAADRDDRRIQALFKQLVLDHVDVTVPSVAVAQAWRGGSRSARLARLLDHCAVDSLDELDELPRPDGYRRSILAWRVHAKNRQNM